MTDYRERDDRKKAGLGLAGLPGPLFGDPDIGRDFLNDPEAFLERLGLRIGDLACPPFAHNARDRAQQFVDAVDDELLTPTVGAIRELSEFAARYFGSDSNALLIPFGLRFAERATVDPGLGLTATATAEFTWLDKGVDHDG